MLRETKKKKKVAQNSGVNSVGFLHSTALSGKKMQKHLFNVTVALCNRKHELVSPSSRGQKVTGNLGSISVNQIYSNQITPDFKGKILKRFKLFSR